MIKDSLGDRMKKYENVSKHRLLTRTPVDKLGHAECHGTLITKRSRVYGTLTYENLKLIMTKPND